MDALFKTDYINKQPLRQYEPIIRFDLEGKPQPRKPLDGIAKRKSEVIETEPKTAGEDLKRKVNNPPAVSEPKKKIQKQSSITSFFRKN